MATLHLIQSDSRVTSGYFGDLLHSRPEKKKTYRLFEEMPLPQLQEKDALIVLGGYMGVHDQQQYPYLADLLTVLRESAEKGTPLLGICLGGQLLAHALGGDVSAKTRGEKGLVEIRLTPQGEADPLFSDIDSGFLAFQWHNDSFTPPANADLLASSRDCPGQAFRYKNAWGLQFHPEVDADLVQRWSEPVDPDGTTYLTPFRAAQQEHYSMAKQLFENFLAQL
ncbi:MAG: hypothetical protein C0621_08270 [Desulfuromonas sp.]|nr:MAG: hypothetical protein C0621_08270 [Desulfuromonas sp.]